MLNMPIEVTGPIELHKKTKCSFFNDIRPNECYFTNLLLQKTNVISGTINSSCNPIFYCLYMPSFRHALLKTFLPCINVTPATRSESNSIEMTSAPKKV